MKVKLELVRLSFPVLFVPEEFQKGDGKPRFSATFLIAPGSENDKRIQAAIQQVAAEAWPQPGKASAMLESLKGNSNKFCYLNGNTKEYDGYKDMLFISAHRKAQDGVPEILGADLDPGTGKLRKLKLEDGIPYAGCYVNGLIDVYAQTKGDRIGIRAGLIAVQFAKHGDAFSGAGRASDDDFAPLTDGLDAGALAAPVGGAGVSAASLV